MRLFVLLFLCFPPLCLSSRAGLSHDEAGVEEAVAEDIVAAAESDAAAAAAAAAPAPAAEGDAAADAPVELSASPAEPSAAAAAAAAADEQSPPDAAAAAAAAPAAASPDISMPVELQEDPLYIPLRQAVKTKEFWRDRALELLMMVVTTYTVIWAYGKMGCPFKRWPLKLLVEGRQITIPAAEEEEEEERGEIDDDWGEDMREMQ
ncbi:uncharacterized protein EMH_0024820 [Eimeria mitis]|uniref:Uncharacterized protein n=1 Tax=Eimeria mitis TaxID=44415 RepID=U6KG53_9EIME|nr:uncharacterized protein EMH_0024820 [Eimeria mitis]CDJ35242.1 hypothetical protein, conserved [Eimeria mitis]